MTLAEEYARDRQKGIHTPVPVGYFPNDDAKQPPITNWKSHANLLFSNWLNLVVYQNTPFNPPI